jgi:nitrile hydratase accessory protein
MGSHVTERAQAREVVERLLSDSEARHNPEEPQFAHPWEIRAFALAVAAHESGRYAWGEFQSALIESIGRWHAEHGTDDEGTWSYYEHWLDALERVLAANGLVDRHEVDSRTTLVLATTPDRHDQHAHPEPVGVDPGKWGVHPDACGHE